MSLLDKINELQAAAEKQLAAADSTDAVEAWRVRYLGSKGELKNAMKQLKDVPAEQKPSVGQALNRLKQALQDAYAARKAALGPSGAVRVGEAKPDITLPGERPRIGHTHILT